FQPNGEMGAILKLVVDIAAQVRHMPAHAERLHRAQHPARIELPRVVGIIQVPKRGKIVLRDHYAYSIVRLAYRAFSKSTRGTGGIGWCLRSIAGLMYLPLLRSGE